jgi:hypothetical protein
LTWVLLLFSKFPIKLLYPNYFTITITMERGWLVIRTTSVLLFVSEKNIFKVSYKVLITDVITITMTVYWYCKPIIRTLWAFCDILIITITSDCNGNSYYHKKCFFLSTCRWLTFTSASEFFICKDATARIGKQSLWVQTIIRNYKLYKTFIIYLYQIIISLVKILMQ